MKTAGPHSALKLVGADVAPVQRLSPPGHTGRPAPGRAGTLAASSAVATAAQRREVEAANKAASMSALDPRWALAVRTNSMLEGGRAAILTPENRKYLVKLGTDISLRPFDANLIIAIVQDAARTGRDPLGSDARIRLKMIPQPSLEPAKGGGATRIIGAILMGGLLAWFLIRAFGS